MLYFYCPNCKNEKFIEYVPQGAIPNIRDGYGRSIYHSECDKCHNLDSGSMSCPEDYDSEWLSYVQDVIGFYQGIRGFKI